MTQETVGDLKRVIEQAWEDRDAVTQDTKGQVREAVLTDLDDGSLLAMLADGTTGD